MNERAVVEIELAEAEVVLLCVAGLHGNEPLAVEALTNVAQRIMSGVCPIHGSFFGYRGNLQALAAQRRFIDSDLNRMWTESHFTQLTKFSGLDKESWDLLRPREIKELFDLRTQILSVVQSAKRRGQEVVFVDIHTTSADGPPFAVVHGDPRTREFISEIPLPALGGLQAQIDGILSTWVSSLGAMAMTIEGGGHRGVKTVEMIETILWQVLRQLDMVEVLPEEVAENRSELMERFSDLPPYFEIRYHHAISKEDRFRMRPGFLNLDRITLGQALGDDRNGVVRAPLEGRILLPLYQEEGSDGFLVVAPC